LQQQKTSVFPLQETPTLAISMFSRIGISSGTAALVKYHFFDKLIFGVRLLHPVFFSDLLSESVV